MTIKTYATLLQGSDEWRAARCGLLTASEMKLILTTTNKPAKNEKERAHLFDLLAQRITGYVDPHHQSDDMLRGQTDEVKAKILYAERFAPVDDAGFITNDQWGFTIGYSPDGLVGDDGLIECKSRRQKFQVQTWINGGVPDEYLLQIQTGLLVSQRKWCDFVSYSGGLPMRVVRVYADDEMQDAIIQAATDFEMRLALAMQDYQRSVQSQQPVIETEREIEQEIYL